MNGNAVIGEIGGLPAGVVEKNLVGICLGEFLARIRIIRLPILKIMELPHICHIRR